MVYLDYNASAPMHEEVVDAMTEALRVVGNPSSVHEYGRVARRLVEEARAEVAALVGAAPEEIVFTSGGTEANNMALAAGQGHRVLVSAIEHDSVLNAAPEAERIAVGADGGLDLDHLGELLVSGEAPALVSVMLANNETGAIQPVAEAAETIREVGALVHSDMVQGPGRIAVDMAALGADMLSLSAHKLGGPKGVGALAVRQGIELPGLIRGGGQEKGRRGGTENVAAIVGFGVAARLAGAGLDEIERIEALRDGLEARVRRDSPKAVVFGSDAPRLANTSCLAVPGIKAETQVMALDLAGVAVSSGSACSSGKIGTSHVLAAMGVEPALAECAIRVSFGRESVAGDVDRFIEAWGALVQRAA